MPSRSVARELAPVVIPTGQLDSEHWTVAHDFAFDYGGAERATAVLANEVLPHSRFVVIGADGSVLDRMGVGDRTDFVRGGKRLTPRNYRAASFGVSLGLPRAEPIDGNLLSSAYAFCHHLRCSGRHVSYCHSPLRQIWSHRDASSERAGKVGGAAFRAAVGPFARRDRRAAALVDDYIATSTTVQDRIERYFGREVSAIVPPPIDVERFTPVESPTRDYYLFAGRLVDASKKIGLALEAFDGLDAKLIVAGSGRDEQFAHELAGPNVEFVGQVDSERLRELYANARALIFPSEEDFGMGAVEAMACGTPAIAYAAGGSLDTIVDGRTGVLFENQTAADLRDAIAQFEALSWNADNVREHSLWYSRENFVRRISAVLGG
ncbi:MAG: glycosyltransferase [Solirubrobacterales bacterium]